MSVIRKTPYIENVLASMSDSNLKDLRTVLNSGGDNVSLDFSTLTNSYKNKVTPVYFKFEDNGLKTGILIWTNSMCALICYHRFQDLIIFELSPTYHTSKKINEYCDINELRRVLDDTIEAKGVIDSGGAAANTVLTADGEGGTSWEDPLDVIKAADTPEGSAQYLLGLDENGNVIKDELPEGIVVDQTVVEDSANAVAGGAVYDFAYSKADIDAKLETKANVDGNYPTMTVGAADNLTPYDESAGDDQDDPFSFQATGTGNGSQADFATGALALMKEKRGNSIVANQYVTNIVTTKTVSGITFTNNGDGTITLNGTATEQIGTNSLGENLTTSATIHRNNHKLLISLGISNAINGFYFGVADYGIRVNQKDFIFSGSDPSNWLGAIACSIDNGTTLNNLKFRPLIFDLTQMFGSNDNIPADLLAHPENWYRYYQGSLAFNAGQIVNANSRYIKCIGRQQWDEEWEVGAYNISTGAKTPNAARIRSKNLIRVIPNTTYYFKAPNNRELLQYDVNGDFISYDGQDSSNTTFTTLPNCHFIAFSMYSQYGTTYNNDITISLYYEGESGYNEYYPYEVLTNNDTGTETLLSAGNVADSKTPNGTIHRVIGSVDLGTLNWTYYSGLFFADVSDIKTSARVKILCTKYATTTSTTWNDMNDKEIGKLGSDDSVIRVKDTTYGTDAATFKTAMSGVTLYYELAEPTTEQGTPFSENLVIDDFGSMEFSGTSGVPQGNLIFYPVDYKAFIDTLYDYTEGTPSDLVKQSELSAEETARENQDTILLNAIGGTLRQCLCVKESLDFDNTDVVDLGSLTWELVSTNAFMTTSAISGLKVPLSTSYLGKYLTTRYKQIAYAADSTNLTFKVNQSGQVRIYDTSFTNATTFKNAMKGVLLAYEKASE